MQGCVNARDLFLDYAKVRLSAHFVERGVIDANGRDSTPWMRQRLMISNNPYSYPRQMALPGQS